MSDKPSLNEIAAQMRRYALEHPRTSTSGSIASYRITLSKGLRLVLFIDLGQTWHLSLYRERVYPSHNELRIVKEAFDAPPEAKEDRRIEGKRWHIIRLQWPGAEQGKLFEVGPAESVPHYQEGA